MRLINWFSNRIFAYIFEHSSTKNLLSLKSAKLVERIRFNTRSKQVYAPIFFSEYGPKFDRHGGISEDNGFWRIYSYGMISIFNHDYRETSGFQLDLKGWGLEDLRFAETVLAAKYAFVRAFEPALYHPFHTKYCKGVVDEQYKGWCNNFIIIHTFQ